MRALVQRVREASVLVEGESVGSIQAGILVYLGVFRSDSESQARRLAERVVRLRHFPDERGRMHHSVLEVGGSGLVVSQFTLTANCRKGRRPSFDDAAAPEQAQQLYAVFVEHLRELGLTTETGCFGAYMLVQSVNDGPQNFLLEESQAEILPGPAGSPGL